MQSRYRYCAQLDMMLLTSFLVLLNVLSLLFEVDAAHPRTSPPAGALSVRAGASSASGMFSTLSAAVNALPNDNSKQKIFIFPGTYNEQVHITRPGLLTIYGYTTDTSNFAANQVVIQAGIPASTAGSDDASGTLRVHKNHFKMYNVNVTNTFGIGSQAIAISQFGNKVGLYACAFIGYQDTLSNEGTQVVLKSYIEGAVDFIFGRTGFAYFGGNTIAVKAPGCITASGRELNDSGSYVFNQNKIILAADADKNTAGQVFLGRPWGDYAKVIFKNTLITAPLNQTIWSIWGPGDPHTDNVFLAEYNSTGSGILYPKRPSFATVLSSSQANMFSIASAVGSDYASWVDTSYLV